MADIIAVASGKGGVGKSFFSSSLAMSLTDAGDPALLVDADLGGANLHNFLGYKVPPVGVYNFLREKTHIEDIITKTPLGIDFVAGSGDVLGMAHITKIERARFINRLGDLGYTHVVMDLGAGTSFNTIDFFNLANRKVIVMNSEPTSVENAYGFIKIALYRYLERFLSSNRAFEEINRRLRNKSLTYSSIDGIVSDVTKIDPDVAEMIKKFISEYRIGIVLNLVRFKKELNVFYGFETIIKKYLSITIEKLGFIPYDEKVSESVRIMQPFYCSNRDSGTVSCIDDIRKMLLAKL
ncbi:MAG: P-loop NTPase [Deferribacteraceae bacterium]|jgi:flagellar biosynthesis protein FlhG|nr:P-loop NTPase [Deferribacteraceae bacterium]